MELVTVRVHKAWTGTGRKCCPLPSSPFIGLGWCPTSQNPPTPMGRCCYTTGEKGEQPESHTLQWRGLHPLPLPFLLIRARQVSRSWSNCLKQERSSKSNKLEGVWAPNGSIINETWAVDIQIICVRKNSSFHPLQIPFFLCQKLNPN